jgi:hypothetical protein
MLTIQTTLAALPISASPSGHCGTTAIVQSPKRAALTRAEATKRCEQKYGKPIRFDDLPAGVDYAVLDFAINSGPSRAVTYLQKVLKMNVARASRRRSVFSAEGAEWQPLSQHKTASQGMIGRGLFDVLNTSNMPRSRAVAGR